MESLKITPCLWFDNQAEEAARFMFPFLKIQNGKHKLLYERRF
jgi:predicted 3-demethylubiquinone-9 3-methyltransferase (glyoxalase superfamily)